MPEATSVPCLASLPAGWDLGGAAIRRDEGEFWLSAELAGGLAVEVAVRPEGEGRVGGATGRVHRGDHEASRRAEAQIAGGGAAFDRRQALGVEDRAPVREPGDRGFGHAYAAGIAPS